MKSISSSNARFSPARSNAQICVYRGSPASSLIDDPRPGLDGFPGRPGSVLRPADVHDVQPVRAEPLKHGPLVHLPAPEQIPEPDVELPGRP